MQLKKRYNKLNESMMTFIESFSDHFPDEVKSIQEAFKLCFENEEDPPNDLNIKIPENASKDEVQKVKEVADKAIRQAEQTAEVKKRLDDDMTRVKTDLERVSTEIQKNTDVK